MKEILIYVDPNGREPYTFWFEKMPMAIQAKADAYVTRVALGGAKNNVKALKDGVFEIKIDFGPGIRVYFGEDGNRIIVLLMGGDKGSQSTDIRKAKLYWRDYEKNKKF